MNNEKQQIIDQQGANLVEVETNYANLPYEKQSTLSRIRQSMVIIAQQIYQMGRDLVLLKENSAHGEFIKDLNDLGLSHSTAKRYMTIALKFNTPKLRKLIDSFNGEKGVLTKLLELSTVSDDKLESLVDGGTFAGIILDDIDRMSVKELREALRKEKHTTKEELQAKDAVIAQKNDHADKLAIQLAKAQGIPEKERWTEQVSVYRKELTTYSLDAEELINTVNNIVLSLEDVDAPESAKLSMALHTKDTINLLLSACGKLSNSVYDQLGFYINQPTYSISDELSMIDEDQGSS